MVYIKQRWSASFQSIPPSLIIEESYLQTFLHTLEQPLEGVLRAYSLKGNIEDLASHYNYRQPLKVAVYFTLFSSATRKRVCVLF